MEEKRTSIVDLPPLCCEEEHNYVAFFLTLSCNLKCPYCINLHDNTYQEVRGRKLLSVEDWIRAANRLVLRDDLPLTLQGGEPTLHKGFYRFVNEVKPEIQMDLMTNLSFDIERFIAEVPVWRFNREAPYAPIRASYHPGQNKADELMRKARRLNEAGFKVGVYGILHPDESIRTHILDVQEMFQAAGLDFRVKEFLGDHNGKIYGTFKYPGSVAGDLLQDCECRTTELIVDPGGMVYRCHADLYAGRDPVACITDPEFTLADMKEWRPCSYYGACNPCDVKVKTNRFQIFGHTSCEIRNIRPRQSLSTGIEKIVSSATPRPVVKAVVAAQAIRRQNNGQN